MNESKKPKISTLEKLKLQKDKLNARIQLLENKEKTKNRKQDTHRKILVGAYYLDKAKQENNMDILVKELDSYLLRTSDRALFGLKPHEPAKP